MASRKLERIPDINPMICEKLHKYNIITVRDYMQISSPLLLMLYTELSLKEVKQFDKFLADKLHSKSFTALEIRQKQLQSKRFISTGISSFDQKLKGGMIIGCISEIVGAPGTGKTQFCLNCTLQAIVAGLVSLNHSNSGSISSTTEILGGDGGGGISSVGGGGVVTWEHKNSVVYIDTELKFDPNRLVQIALETYPEIYSSEYRADAPHQVDQLLNAVKVKRPLSMQALQQELQELQTTIISKHVNLVVIDSIAALARKEGFSELQKEEFFISQTAELKKIAELCQCVILATNQVTPSGNMNPSDLYGDAIYDDSEVYQPTLGPTWHHCISTRFTIRMASVATSSIVEEQVDQRGNGLSGEHFQSQQLHIQSHHQEGNSESRQNMIRQRCLSVVKCPMAAQASINVIISSKGLVACHDNR